MTARKKLGASPIGSGNSPLDYVVYSSVLLLFFFAIYRVYSVREYIIFPEKEVVNDGVIVEVR